MELVGALAADEKTKQVLSKFKTITYLLFTFSIWRQPAVLLLNTVGQKSTRMSRLYQEKN
jgi:hypothetical protein